MRAHLVHDLRVLLRETAQPVAVVTALLPNSCPSRYHGATLSSFTSVAFDPLPLVAFSLRVPSRMASALNTSSSAHFVVNILSAAQPHLAERFARPDIHPHPFADPHVRYTTSQDGVPILSGALGALACRLVGPSLSLAGLQECQEEAGEAAGLASELFIARVLRVEGVPLLEDDARSELQTLPLVYHRRRYTTVADA